MFKYVKAYLYGDKTVVLNKSDIKNAKDEDFKEVSLWLSEEFIQESAEEIEMCSDDEEDCEYED